MKPYLFTGPTRQRRRLRDYVIDLNREKNFNQIVTHFCATFRQAARAGQPFPARVLAVHTAAELRQIMGTNLRRLAIDFENGARDAISGRSDDWMGPGECWDWWMDFFFGKDGDDSGEGTDEGAPADDDLNGVPVNERDQMRQVLDEIDGKN